MSQVRLEDIIEILKEFSSTHPLDIILVGGLSMQYYGLKERTTVDLDGEVKGNIEALFNFLRKKGIPADIGENISSWSVISLPSGYRDRTIKIYSDDRLNVRVLDPIDFIIAKIRRFTEIDLNDALFVAKRYSVNLTDIRKAASNAIENTPMDTSIFTFKKHLEIFIDKFCETM